MTEMHWTLEQYPAAIVDGIRGQKLPTEEPPAVLVRCDGRATRPLDDDDWRELAGVWQAAGLPLEPLAEGVGLFRAFDYVEAFNARPGYAGWQVGAVPGRDAHHVERVSACIAQDEVREELREAMQSGSVTPRRPRSMTRATPHEVGFRPGLVLTAADLEAAGLGVPAEVAPTPAPSASASAVVAPAPVARQLPRQRHQEAEILRVLRELGHEPHALPRNPPGMAGPKAAAFGRLGWKKEERGVFEKAWDRLRQARDITDA